ncbi:MAG: transketolase family protein [Deltaproteobacteria bacterium]|nr:MAG: transketolase family protein [Deltaproteobacteria bacterium]TMA69932.1 MAG: transketolase family protein [Deltaproteobacteria bacterium]TMB13826.1 MAG: transketolase family protein [Deltaproteobacteria bacterium]
MSGYFAALSAADVLVELAERNPDVVLLTQDFGAIGAFTARFPERHFDLGISEANLVGVAAGMAHAGMLPFVLAMAPFVSMRAFEQIRDDCAYNRNNVKLLAPFAGLEAGPWGATHHAIEDIALLRSIPGMTVLSPADPNESLRAVRAAAEIEGPVYIRLGFLSPLDGYEAEFRVGEAVTIREGRDLTLVATGGCVGTVLAVREALRADGISARVLNVHTLKPLDRAAIERAARETGRLLTVEEHSILGGLGGAVAEVLAELGTGRLARVGLRDVFATEVAPYPELLRLHGLDAAGVEAAARALLGLG